MHVQLVKHTHIKINNQVPTVLKPGHRITSLTIDNKFRRIKPYFSIIKAFTIVATTSAAVIVVIVVRFRRCLQSRRNIEKIGREKY